MVQMSAHHSGGAVWGRSQNAGVDGTPDCQREYLGPVAEPRFCGGGTLRALHNTNQTDGTALHNTTNLGQLSGSREPDI